MCVNGLKGRETIPDLDWSSVHVECLSATKASEPKMLQASTSIVKNKTEKYIWNFKRCNHLLNHSYILLHFRIKWFFQRPIKEQAVSRELTEALCLFLLCPTEEQAFRKRRLCIKFIPRDSTEAAICDIRILGRSKQAPPQYTFIGWADDSHTGLTCNVSLLPLLNCWIYRWMTFNSDL